MNFAEKEKITQVADRIVEDMKLAGVALFTSPDLSNFENLSN